MEKRIRARVDKVKKGTRVQGYKGTRVKREEDDRGNDKGKDKGAGQRGAVRARVGVMVER